MRKIRLISLIFITLILLGCGAKEVREVEGDEALYESAMKELSEEKRGFPWVFSGTDYETILKNLKEIQLRYTYSPYATLAELRTGDTYFEQEEYEQAIIEYDDFIKRHPSHEEIPYATYRLALSHYRKIMSPDRDPTHTREAIRWLNVLIENYPDSAFASEAAEKKSNARKKLAEREIYIGEFYTKRENYKAAAERFKVVVDEYDDTNKLEEALFLLGKSYLEMDEVNLARETLERVADESEAEYRDDAAELLAEIESKEKSERKN